MLQTYHNLASLMHVADCYCNWHHSLSYNCIVLEPDPCSQTGSETKNCILAFLIQSLHVIGVVAACHSSYRANSIIYTANRYGDWTYFLQKHCFIYCHCSCWMYLFSATPAVECLFGGVGPHMHVYFGSTLKMSLIHASYRCDRVRPWCSEEATVYLTQRFPALRAGNFNVWDHNCNSVLNTWNVLPSLLKH